MGPIHTRSLLAACASFMLASAAPSLEHYTTLVGTVGTDTVAVDRFMRTSSRLEGVLLIRRPTIQLMHYKGSLAPEGRFSAMEIVWRDVRGVEVRSATLSYGTDSIRSQIKEGTERFYGAPPRLNAIPLPPVAYAVHCYAMIEHGAMRLLMSKQPGVMELEWINAGALKAETRSIRRSAGDTIEINYIAGPVRAVSDTEHRVKWIFIGTAPLPTIVRRSASDINIEKLAASFASRDTL